MRKTLLANYALQTELIRFSTGSTPESAYLTAMKIKAEKPSLDFLICELNSSKALAIAKALAGSEYLAVSPTAAISELGKKFPNFFIGMNTNRSQATLDWEIHLALADIQEIGDWTSCYDGYGSYRFNWPYH